MNSCLKILINFILIFLITQESIELPNEVKIETAGNLRRKALGHVCSFKDPEYSQVCEQIVPVALIDQYYLELHDYALLCNAVNLGDNQVAVPLKCFSWGKPVSDKHFVSSGSNSWCKNSVFHVITDFKTIEVDGTSLVIMNLYPPLAQPCKPFIVSNDSKQSDMIGWKKKPKHGSYEVKENTGICDSNFPTATIFKKDGSFVGFQNFECKDNKKNEIIMFKPFWEQTQKLPKNINPDITIKVSTVMQNFSTVMQDYRNEDNQKFAVTNKLNEYEIIQNQIQTLTNVTNSLIEDTLDLIDENNEIRKEIEELDAVVLDINTCEKDLCQIIQDLLDMNSEMLSNFSILQQTTSDFNRKFSDMEIKSNFSGFNSTLECLRNDIFEIRDSVRNKSELINLQNLLNEVTDQNDICLIKMMEHNNSLQKIKDTLEGNNITLFSILDVINTDIKNQLLDLNYTTDDLDKKLIDLKNRFLVIEDAINGINQEIKNKVSHSNSSIESLKIELSKLKERIESMLKYEKNSKNTFSELQSNNNDIKSQLLDLNHTVVDLITITSDSNSKYKRLENEQSELKETTQNRNEKLKQDISSLKTENYELKNQLLDLQNWVNNISDQNKMCDNFIMDYNNSLQKIENMFEDNEKNDANTFSELQLTKTNINHTTEHFDEQIRKLENKLPSMEKVLNHMFNKTNDLDTELKNIQNNIQHLINESKIIYEDDLDLIDDANVLNKELEDLKTIVMSLINNNTETDFSILNQTTLDLESQVFDLKNEIIEMKGFSGNKNELLDMQNALKNVTDQNKMCDFRIMEQNNSLQRIENMVEENKKNSISAFSELQNNTTELNSKFASLANELFELKETSAFSEVINNLTGTNADLKSKLEELELTLEETINKLTTITENSMQLKDENKYLKDQISSLQEHFNHTNKEKEHIIGNSQNLEAKISIMEDSLENIVRNFTNEVTKLYKYSESTGNITKCLLKEDSTIKNSLTEIAVELDIIKSKQDFNCNEMRQKTVKNKSGHKTKSDKEVLEQERKIFEDSLKELKKEIMTNFTLTEAKIADCRKNIDKISNQNIQRDNKMNTLEKDLKDITSKLHKVKKTGSAS